jgi:ABC-type transporter Mla subunit MlaD
MSTQKVEDIITTLYDMIQDARSLPLGADKCILERDKVLDLLDEIIAALPGELKQSRNIVDSRNEVISQARREAESIVRNAQEEAARLVSEQEILAEAKRQCQELIRRTQHQCAEIRKASTSYMAAALRNTEEAMAKALGDVRETQAKFGEMAAKFEAQNAVEE